MTRPTPKPRRDDTEWWLGFQAGIVTTFGVFVIALIAASLLV